MNKLFKLKIFTDVLIERSMETKILNQQRPGIKIIPKIKEENWKHSVTELA